MCSNRSTSRQSNHQPRSRRDGHRSNWTGINIAAMVVGFVAFWPLGLFMVYWIVTGHDVRELPEAIKSRWAQLRGYKDSHGHSDNVVFNEYQETQYDRIREIKDEIKSRAQRFSDYRAEAKRRADEEEFNRFMGDSSVPIDNA